MTVHTFDWTDQAVDTLRTMWAAGSSATEIARALHNPSRNSVLGKLGRLGLLNPGPHRKSRRTNPVKAVAPAPKLKAPPPNPPRALKQQPIAAAPRPECPPVRLIDRNAFRQCGWPIGEVEAERTLMCGAPVEAEGKPYCAYHAERSRQPRRAA